MKNLLLVIIFFCSGFIFSVNGQGKDPDNFPFTLQKMDSTANCRSGLVMMGGQPVCKFFVDPKQFSLPSGSYIAIYRQEPNGHRWTFTIPKNKIVIRIGDWPVGTKNLAGVGEELKNCSSVSIQSTKKASNELAKSFKNNGYTNGQRFSLTIALD